MTRRLIVVACCLLTTTAALRLAAATEVTPGADRLAQLPAAIAPWQRIESVQLDRETEKILSADRYVLETYSRGAAPISLFVAYYGSQRSGRTIHSPLNCLPGTGWEWIERSRVSLPTDRGDIAINRNVARKDGQQLLVYYWYQSRGRVVASDYANKALLVRDALALHRSDGALVRVTADVPRIGSGDEAAAFIRTLYPALVDHLPE